MPRLLRIVLLLAPLLSMGCAQPLHLRFDLAGIPRSQRLTDLRLAFVVDDARQDLAALGRHRDGIARIPQHGYEATVPPEVAVRHAFEHAALAQGARIVLPEQADYVLSARIIALDVTTDGFWAGEDTAADVVIDVFLSGRDGRIVFVERFEHTLENPQHADAQVLSDAILTVVNRATRRIPQRTRTLAAR